MASPDSQNPYRPIELEPEQLDRLEKILNTDLLVWRSIMTVVMSALFFGVAGAVIGWLLGLLVPEYYRQVFDAMDRIEFNPKLVGLGLGLTQGLIAGTVVGCVAILAAAIYKSRMSSVIREKIAGQGMSKD